MMNKCLIATILFLAVPFAQAEEGTTLETITVTGARDDVTMRRDAATQKVIIDRKELDSYSVMTIGEVLGKLPGVEIKGGGQRARGMSRDSVQILIDGERQAGGAMGASGVLGRMPSDNLERVEILRGSSAEYGGSAPLTVNIVLKKALPKRSTDFKAGIGVRGEEPNYQLSWTENGGSGNFAWSLPISLNFNNSTSHSLSDRQDSTAGTRTLWQQENTNSLTKFGHHAFSPRLTWKSGKDSLTISPMFFNGPMDKTSDTQLTQYTNPAAGTGVVFNGERVSREEASNRMWRLRVEGEKHVGETKLTGRVAFNNGRRTLDVVRDARDAANVLTTFTESTHSTDNEFNSAMRLDQSFGMHLLSVGAEYVNVRHNDAQQFGGGFAAQGDHNTASRDSIVWLQDDWTPQDAFTLTTGLRLENMRLDAENISQQHVGLLPSIAARWQPTEQWVLRTSLGAGMKMPKLDEISESTTRSVAANTPVEADKRGNASLRPERSVNFEAVVEHYLPQKAGVIGANIYVRSTSDFTERRVQLEGARWVDRPYNEGDALHYGVELDAKVKMDGIGWKGATAKAHLTLPHARVDDVRLGFTRMARDTPNYVFSMGLDQSIPKWQSSYGVSLQLSGRSETNIPNEQSAYTEARATLDAFWLYKLTPIFNVRLAGKNLLAADTRNQSAFVSGSNDWQLNTFSNGQRSLMLTLEGRW
ncbi:MAG: TonB-dependent receptor [Methylotenera sp.]|nr:TonB-dependent receptor [Methylotenera sp.]